MPPSAPGRANAPITAKEDASCRVHRNARCARARARNYLPWVRAACWRCASRLRQRKPSASTWPSKVRVYPRQPAAVNQRVHAGRHPPARHQPRDRRSMRYGDRRRHLPDRVQQLPADAELRPAIPGVLDELTRGGPGGRPGSRCRARELVTSFSSKSELALNLSHDGGDRDVHGVRARRSERSTSPTRTRPGALDPTNPVPGTDYPRGGAAGPPTGRFDVHPDQRVQRQQRPRGDPRTTSPGRRHLHGRQRRQRRQPAAEWGDHRRRRSDPARASLTPECVPDAGRRRPPSGSFSITEWAEKRTRSART